ncbi:MAG: VWA domain-containing protein [Acidobacteria bacterium]|nr:VWA domain-containing protein [Acidobacteriota bacterium]MBV9069585.1 VWA domain-containing protein [Acidobacteriota bacterium]MBV9188184.1 VWA domain-containing protein [Acidobacteriota bacterium]
MSRVLACTALFVALPLLAQSVVAPMSESVSVGYVMIPFTVLGDHGRPITDLRNAEVNLTVDGAPVRSDMFEKSQNAPVSFTILLDGSGSMALAGKMDSAFAAIGALIGHRRPGDDFALYVFAESQAIEVAPFTENPNDITRALGHVKPYGKTAFFDALATMPERSKLGRNPTRAIILLSDGIDNASSLTRGALAQQLQGISVPIYSLGLRQPEQPVDNKKRPREDLSDIGLLNEVATLTGGKLYLGNTPQQIAEAVSHIEDDLRAQYLIGFAPTGKGAVKYRTISLKLAGRARAVRVRAGYLGTEPPMVASRNKQTERKGSL